MNHKQQSLTWFSWKRLIIILVLVFLLLIAIYIFSISKQIKASKTDGFEQSTSMILEDTDIIEIDEMYAFQHDILYHIGYGKNKQKDKLIAFVPKTTAKKENQKDKDKQKKENSTKEIITVKVSEIVSKKEIESKWNKECEQCMLKSSAPAMIDEVPLWELTYLDTNGRFVFEYIELEDGEIYEQLKMKRKYKTKG